MAGVGSVITLIEAILPFLNVTVNQGEVGEAINGIVSFVGFILLVWGQIRRKDLIAGIVRRKVI